MRKLLIALTTLIAALTLTGPASAATTVHAHALGAIRPFATVWPDQGSWVGKADATTIAWGSLEQGSTASTVSDGGTVRSLPAQPGCTAKAAGGGHVAYDCGAWYDGPSVRLSTRVVSLAGGVEADDAAVVPLQAGRVPAVADVFVGNYTLDGIGTRWLHYTQTCFKYCSSMDSWSEDVDWRTGEAHKIATVDPSLHEDLDARALTVPLCAPLRSDLASMATAETPWAVPVVVDRPWALLARPPVTGDEDVSWRVQRCGSSRPVSLPAGSEPVAIGGGWVLLEHEGTPGPIRLLRLADHRLMTVTGAPAAPMSQAAHMQAAITSKRVVFAVASGGTDRLFTARLPRH